MKTYIVPALVVVFALIASPLMAAPAMVMDVEECTVFDATSEGGTLDPNYNILPTAILEKGHQVVTQSINDNAVLHCKGAVALPEYGLPAGAVQYTALDNPYTRETGVKILCQIVLERDAEGNVVRDYQTEEWQQVVTPAARSSLLCTYKAK
jgi:hypothetical protein